MFCVMRGEPGEGNNIPCSDYMSMKSVITRLQGLRRDNINEGNVMKLTDLVVRNTHKAMALRYIDVKLQRDLIPITIKKLKPFSLLIVTEVKFRQQNNFVRLEKYYGLGSNNYHRCNVMKLSNIAFMLQCH